MFNPQWSNERDEGVLLKINKPAFHSSEIEKKRIEKGRFKNVRMSKGTRKKDSHYIRGQFEEKNGVKEEEN